MEDADKIVGLELGADDYITKPFNAREVVARVNALLRHTWLDQMLVAAPRVLVFGGLRLDLDQHTLLIGGQPVELTRTVFNLLQVFMENPGYMLTRDDLLERGHGGRVEAQSAGKGQGSQFSIRLPVG